MVVRSPAFENGSADDDAWYKGVRASLMTDVPELTRVQEILLGQRPTGAIDSTILVNNSLVNGGPGVADDSTHLKITTAIWQNLRVDPAAAAWRAKFPAIAATKTAGVAMSVSGAGGGLIFFGWAPNDPTKWVLLPAGGTPIISAFNADTLEHTITMTSRPAVNLIVVKIDGTEVARSTDIATLTNTPAGISYFASASLTPGVVVSRAAYGFRDP